MAPVTKPTVGPPRIPLIMIGSWVKCTVTPMGNGMAIGGIDRMVAIPAINAMKGSFHVRVRNR